MTEAVHVDDRITGFSVDIRWDGSQDKPYYRATLVSESRRGSVSEEPFRGVAVIGLEELRRLVTALERHDVSMTPGNREEEGMGEYVIELSLEDSAFSGSLGDERRSLPILADLRDALDEGHRQPLDNLLGRLEGWTDA